MKALSLAQAQSCENALHPTCKCRCGGALHGIKRNGEDVPERSFFESLPEDDPHHLIPKKQQEPPTPVSSLVQLALPFGATI